MVCSFITAAGWRTLLPEEVAFIRQYFGAQTGTKLIARVRLGVRRLGDTRRALCIDGGLVSLPRQCFLQSSGSHPLRLMQPQVAGVFAHELLHELQRMHGIAVTREAVLLQYKWLVKRCDPYFYSCIGNSRALLRQFLSANVEQQAQMWQDFVQSHVAGHPLPSHALLPLAVQSARLRKRNTR